MRRLRTALAAAFPATALVAGCAGGNHAAPPLPSAAPSPSAAAKTQYAKVVLSLKIPAHKRTSAPGRGAKFVGSSPQTALVFLNGNYSAPFTGTCSGGFGQSAGRRPESGSCSVSLTVPLGAGQSSVSATFDIGVYGSSGYLTAATSSSVTEIVTLNSANGFSITLGGVAAFARPYVTCAQAGQFPGKLQLAVFDADGDEITGPYTIASNTAGTIANPFTLTMGANGPPGAIAVGGTSYAQGQATAPITGGTQNVLVTYGGSGAGVMTAAATSSGPPLVFAYATAAPASASASPPPPPTVTLPDYENRLAYVSVPGYSSVPYFGTQFFGSSVAVINVASRSQCGEIDLAGDPAAGNSAAAPSGIAVTPDGGTLFVADGLPFVGGWVDVIDQQTGAIAALEDVNGQPLAVGYDGGGAPAGTLYVADGTSNVMTVSNAETCDASCSGNVGSLSGAGKGTYGTFAFGNGLLFAGGGSGYLATCALPCSGALTVVDDSGLGLNAAQSLGVSGTTLFVDGIGSNGDGYLFTASADANLTGGGGVDLGAPSGPNGPQALAVVNGTPYYANAGLFTTAGGTVISPVCNGDMPVGVTAAATSGVVWSPTTSRDIVDATTGNCVLSLSVGFGAGAIAFGPPDSTLNAHVKQPQHR